MSPEGTLGEAVIGRSSPPFHESGKWKDLKCEQWDVQALLVAIHQNGPQVVSFCGRLVQTLDWNLTWRSSPFEKRIIIVNRAVAPFVDFKPRPALRHGTETIVCKLDDIHAQRKNILKSDALILKSGAILFGLTQLRFPRFARPIS
jgi:hypothetical protein